MRGGKVDKLLLDFYKLVLKPLLPHKHPDVDDLSFLEDCLETDKIHIKIFKAVETDTYVVRRRISFRNYNYLPDKVKINKSNMFITRDDERLPYVEVEVLDRFKLDSIEYRFTRFEYSRLIGKSREILCDESHYSSVSN